MDKLFSYVGVTFHNKIIGVVRVLHISVPMLLDELCDQGLQAQPLTKEEFDAYQENSPFSEFLEEFHKVETVQTFLRGEYHFWEN